MRKKFRKKAVIRAERDIQEKKVREEAKEDAMTEDVGGPSGSNPYGRRFQEEGRSRTEARCKSNSSTEVDRYIDDVN